MTIKVGINGCGRIGRLFLRAAWQWPEFDFIQLNDPAGDAHTPPLIYLSSIQFMAPGQQTLMAMKILFLLTATA